MRLIFELVDLVKQVALPSVGTLSMSKTKFLLHLTRTLIYPSPQTKSEKKHLLFLGLKPAGF